MRVPPCLPLMAAIAGLPPVLQALVAGLVTLLLTAAGAAGRRGDLAAGAAMRGFTLMMVLDVALG